MVKNEPTQYLNIEKLLLEINQRAADEYVDYGDDDSYNNFAGWWTSLKELFVAGGNN